MLRHRFITASCPLFLLLATLPAVGQFSFAPTSNVPSGSQPGGVASADFDGDGDIDLATGARFPDRVIILLNDGAGGFTAGPVINYPNNSQPEEVLAGDLDGDGDADLAVILRALSQVRVAVNLGGLVFVDGASAPIGANGRGMDIDDMDNDGDLDLAVANRGSNTATVLTNDGTGVFASQVLPSAGEPRAAAFGDLDGDGDLDLAVTNNDAFNVRLFQNTRGNFVPWQILSTAPNQAEGVTAVDLDNDGDIDIATGAEDDNVGVNNAVIFLNAGGGVFGGPIAIPTNGIGTSGVVAVDLNCDGLPDLAVANQDSNNVSIMENLGGAIFGPASLLPVGTNPETFNFADLDQDLLPDLITANRDSGNLSVLLNETCLPADLDHNGIVDVLDLLVLLGSWGDCTGCLADLDDDGVVGVLDLCGLLGAWGASA